MPELGPYAGEVLSAYAVAFGLLGALVIVSLWKSARVRRALDEIEARREPRRNG